MGNLLCDCVQREEEKENQKEEELNSNISSSEVSESPISEIENHRLISTESIKIDKKLLIGKAEGDIREKYNIGKKLGEGSYGEVYLSIDKKTNKKVAIKVLPKHKSHIDEFNSEIINEIDILKNLEHQNIVKIYEFYEGKKNFYIVTEYCNEGNLKKTIDKKEFITEIEAAAIMFQLFSAIAYCNQNKINKCDMWSLGVILYYLFTKRLPFKAKNKPQLSYYIQNCKYNINLGPLKHASEELKDLIKRLFVVNIDDRLSVNDALNHIWFKKLQIKEKLSELSTEQIKECLINIKKYKPEKVLQQASIAFLIHNFSHYEGIKIANSLYLKIDHNNNGVIEKNEFIKELTNLFKEQNEEIKEEYILELFDIIDADKSGYIEHEEFIRAAANKNNLLKESILKNCFEYFDKDKNGEITVDEIKTTFKDYKEKLTDEEFISVIKECDLNQNGVIDYDEFKTVMATILI